MGLVKNENGNWIYGEKIEVILDTKYKGMMQKLQFKQLYIPFNNNSETVPALCFEVQKVYVTPSGNEEILMSKILPFTDANKRVVKDNSGNNVLEHYFESEITGYTETPVLDSEGNPAYEADGVTPTVTKEPIFTSVEKTRAKIEGELEYWIRTLGQLILPACQKTVESLKPLFDN